MNYSISYSLGGIFYELLANVASLIPEDKIRYAMGVGTPDDIIFCVENGWDIFDTVLPTRNARHGFLCGASSKHRHKRPDNER